MKENRNDPVQKWLETARWAASGGNAQPWVVEYTTQGGRSQLSQIHIHLKIDPNYRQHPSLMDVNGIASAMALGCLTTTLVSMAHWDGYSLARIDHQPESSIWTSSVVLQFEEHMQGQSLDYTPEEILKRNTDRHRFKTTPVPQALNEFLEHALKKYSGLSMQTFKENKNRLNSTLFELENIRWQNKPLFESLLSEISFAEKDASALRKIPHYQLGISSLDEMFLRLLKKYPLFRALLRLGLHRPAVGKIVRDSIVYSERICFLQAPDVSFRSGFEMGRCFQELWLEANRNGVSFQPIASPLIALGFWKSPANYGFSPKQVSVLSHLTLESAKQFSLDFKNLTIGFRIGWPEQATQVGVRQNLVGIRKESFSQTA